LPDAPLSAHPAFKKKRGNDKDHDSRDYRQQPPLGRIAHQQAVRTQSRSGAQTKGVGVVLIGPPNDLGVGGPTNLILSAQLAHCRHPRDVYHFAHPKRNHSEPAAA